MIRASLVSVVVLAASIAHADAMRLAAARKALAAVDYAAAKDLLARAFEEGGNSPADLAEIYRLAANTATVLGERTLAETYYRRWLSLDPDATVTTDAATKFREPFIAAQAFVRQNGALRVDVGTRGAHDIALALRSDAMQLATTASLVDDPRTGEKLDAHQRVVLRVPAGNAMVHVYVFDAYGNRVFERSFATFSAIPREVRGEPVSVLRRWPVWAVPALAFTAGAIYFAHSAGNAQDELDGYAGTRGEVFYDRVTSAVHRRDQQRAIATGLGIGAGACAIVAIAVAVWRPHPRERAIAVTPSVSSAGAAVSLEGQF